MAQGLNYLNYHRAQHGGMAPYPSSVDAQILGEGLRGPALLNSLDKEFADIAGLKDASPPQIHSLADGRVNVNGAIPLVGLSNQTGGRKRRGQKKSQKKGKKSQRKSQRRRRQQGGEMPALGYQTVGAPGLLLETSKQYSNAGLNPDYTGGISTNYVSTEQMDANARDRA